MCLKCASTVWTVDFLLLEPWKRYSFLFFLHTHKHGALGMYSLSSRAQIESSYSPRSDCLDASGYSQQGSTTNRRSRLIFIWDMKHATCRFACCTDRNRRQWLWLIVAVLQWALVTWKIPVLFHPKESFWYQLSFNCSFQTTAGKSKQVVHLMFEGKLWTGWGKKVMLVVLLTNVIFNNSFETVLDKKNGECP